MALLAAPMATRRVRGVTAAAKSSQSSCPRAASQRTVRSVTPRSRATACQGATLAWWSSSVTTISSPGPQPRPSARADVERQRRHVVAEGDLRRRRVQEVGQGAPRVVEQLVGLEARRKVPVRVGVVVQQVVGHRVDDPLRDLRAARPVEIGDRRALVDACQRGELARGWRRRRRLTGGKRRRRAAKSCGGSVHLAAGVRSRVRWPFGSKEAESCE